MHPTRLSLALLSCALLVTLVAPPAAAETGGLRYTITVTKFENRANWRGYWDLGDAWGLVMTDLLHQSGRFIVLGETDMRNEALAEQDFAASGRTAGGAKAPVTGQMTPAQLLVKGAITHVEHDTAGGGGGVRIKGFRVGGGGGKSEINVTMQVVDSTTGQVVASTSVVGKAGRRGVNVAYSEYDWGANADAFKKDNLGRAVEDAVAQGVDWMVDQLPSIPWTGSVALVKDGQVYVNRGTREGVSTGQVFVVGQSDVIRDPDTGEVLDESLTEVAQLRAVEVKEKLSICSVTSGNAAAVQRGMAVHLP